MTTYIELDNLNLALAAGLLLINGALSIVLQLGVARRLFVAAARMVVQLALVALVLQLVFATVSPWLTASIGLVMVLFAGQEIVARQTRSFTGWWSYGLGVGCMAVAALTMTLFAMATQIQVEPWYHPRYVLPILGMILGNTMTSIALGLDTLTTSAGRERPAIEAQLALGATRREAFRPLAQAAMRSALMPTVNAMAATGLVHLPGMMTGQVLAGVDPIEAAKYQVLIMFLIAGGTGLGAGAAIVAGIFRLTDERHRLRIDRLRESKDG